VHNAEEAIDFLCGIDEIGMNDELAADIREYAASDVIFPKRYKIRPRVYFIIIKTEASSMLDFKEKKALKQRNDADVRTKDKGASTMMMALNTECPGWYEGTIDFKRVLMVPGTGKFQYRDTRFVANVKALSPADCYDRIVAHLRSRVDERSQFPSMKGKNFRYKYLGAAK
jgi:hypothetical protein